MTHIKRRTKPCLPIVTHFATDLTVAKEQFSPGCILNADETCCRVFNGRLKTLSHRGADHVEVLSAVDEKESITAIACVTMDGRRLPLIILAKGTTSECEERYRTHPRLKHLIRRKQLYVFHTESGWSTEEFAVQFLDWVVDVYLKDSQGLLIWDLHASHKTDSVKQAATSKGIGLLFIPAGQTDYWQPLDNKVFGALKAAAKRKFDEMMVYRNLTEVDIMDAIEILVKCWSELQPGLIKSSWDHINSL